MSNENTTISNVDLLASLKIADMTSRIRSNAHRADDIASAISRLQSQLESVLRDTAGLEASINKAAQGLSPMLAEALDVAEVAYNVASVKRIARRVVSNVHDIADLAKN